MDKFKNDYPNVYNMFIDMFSRINELEYQNAKLKSQLEEYENVELANRSIREYVYDNMPAINYMDKYLRDIGSI